MRFIFCIMVPILILMTACANTDDTDTELETYDMYGTVDSIEENTIRLDTTTWSLKRGDIPEDAEYGTENLIIIDEETRFLFENGDYTSWENIHEHQQLGIIIGENGETEVIIILRL